MGNCGGQLCNLSSLIFYLFDVGTDINVCYNYFKENDYLYFWITLTFILVPSMITNFYNIRLFEMENQLKTMSKKKYFTFLTYVQLSPLVRYFQNFNLKGSQKATNEVNIALLNIMEAFFESAPQLILQITSIMLQFKNGQTGRYIFLNLNHVATNLCF